LPICGWREGFRRERKVSHGDYKEEYSSRRASGTRGNCMPLRGGRGHLEEPLAQIFRRHERPSSLVGRRGREGNTSLAIGLQRVDNYPDASGKKGDCFFLIGSCGKEKKRSLHPLLAGGSTEATIRPRRAPKEASMGNNSPIRCVRKALAAKRKELLTSSSARRREK